MSTDQHSTTTTHPHARRRVGDLVTFDLLDQEVSGRVRDVVQDAQFGQGLRTLFVVEHEGARYRIPEADVTNAR